MLDYGSSTRGTTTGHKKSVNKNKSRAKAAEQADVLCPPAIALAPDLVSDSQW